MAKRKGYATIEDQMAADKRYLENNPEAKERKKYSTTKSRCKHFILKMSTLEDLNQVKDWIKERENKGK